MSLINQMLKDIDQRQGHAGSAGSGASGMALNVARNPSGAKVPVRLWGGILVLVMLAATYGLRHMTRQNTVPVTPSAQQAGASPGEGRPAAQAAGDDTELTSGYSPCRSARSFAFWTPAEVSVALSAISMAR